MLKKSIILSLFAMTSIVFFGCVKNEPTQMQEEVVCSKYRMINIGNINYKDSSDIKEKINDVLNKSLNNICMKINNEINDDKNLGILKGDEKKPGAEYTLNLTLRLREKLHDNANMPKNTTASAVDIASNATLKQINSNKTYNSTIYANLTKYKRKTINIGEDATINGEELTNMVVKTISNSIRNAFNRMNNDARSAQ